MHKRYKVLVFGPPGYSIPQQVSDGHDVFVAGSRVILSLADIEPEVVLLIDPVRIPEAKRIVDAAWMLPKTPHIVSLGEQHWNAEWSKIIFDQFPNAETLLQPARHPFAFRGNSTRNLVSEVSSATNLSSFVRKITQMLELTASVIRFDEAEFTRWTIIAGGESHMVVTPKHKTPKHSLVDWQWIEENWPKEVYSLISKTTRPIPTISISDRNRWTLIPSNASKFRSITLQGLLIGTRSILYEGKIERKQSTQAATTGRLTVLEQAVQCSKDPIIAADREGKLVLCNAAAADILGYPVSRILKGDINVKAIYDGDTASVVFKAMIQDWLSGGNGELRDYETQLVHASDRVLPVSLNARLLFDKEQVTGSVGVFHNLSEIRRLQALTHSIDEKTIDQVREETTKGIAGATAHRLNQPLQLMQTALELMARKVDDLPAEYRAEWAERVQTALLSVDQTTALIRELAQYDRYDAQSYAGDREKIAGFGKNI